MSADGRVVIDTELNTKEAEKQAQGLGSNLRSGLSKGAKVATAGLMAVGTAVTTASVAMVKGAQKTAEMGDHIDKMSQKLGLSAKAYQQWDYVAKISGTNIDSLKMGFKTLTNTIDKANQGDDKAIESFKRIGMSIDDLKGKSKEDIFKNTVESLQKMSNETERSAMANKLLGRAGMELGPMLNSSKGSIDELMKKAEEYGMVMSDKAVKASAAFKDSVTTMEMTFTGLKNRLMGEFLPSLTQVTDGLALVFKGDTDEGIAKINEGITGFIDKLSEIMPKVLKIGGNIITSLVTAILENLPQLITAGTNIVLQLLQGILNALPQIIQGLVEAIPQIIQALGEALPQIIQGVLMALQTLVIAIAENLPTIITSLIEALINALPVLIQGLIQFVMAIVENLPTIITNLINALPQIITMVITGLVNAIPQLIQGLIQLIVLLVQNLPKIILALIKALPTIIKAVVNGLIKALPQLIKGNIQLIIMLVKNLPKIIMGLIKAIPTIIVEVVKALIEALPILIKGVWSMITSIINNLPKMLTKLWLFVKEIPKKIWENLKGILHFGADLIKGFWEGIKNLGSWIWKKIKGFFGGITKGIKKFFGISSPSKLMRDEVGKFIAQGIWVGFDENNPMDEINKTLASGYADLETSYKMDLASGVIDYGKMAQAFSELGLVVQFNNREVGRMVREFA